MTCRHAFLFSVLGAALAGCGGAAAAPSPAAPTAAPATATVVATTPAGECLATVIADKPTAPTEKVGSVTVRLDKETKSCSMELRRGATPSKPLSCGATKDDYMKSAGDAACSIGGDVLLLMNRDTADKTGTAELDVLRFTKPDPQGDLAMICAPFSAIKNPRTGTSIDESGIDPSQKARIRAQWLESTLTSPEWRGWLTHFATDHAAGVAKLRASVKTSGLTCEAEWVKY